MFLEGESSTLRKSDKAFNMGKDMKIKIFIWKLEKDYFWCNG